MNVAMLTLSVIKLVPWILMMVMFFGIGYLVGTYGFENVCNKIIKFIQDILKGMK